MKLTFPLPLLAFLALLSPTWMGLPRAIAQATSNPPDLMVFQGDAVDGAGQPLGAAGSTNQPAVFRVFDAYTGGRLLWAEQHVLTIEGGRFAVLLGEGTPRVGEPRPPLSSLFLDSSASDRYVELTLLGSAASGGDRVVSPRMRLMSAPTAFLSRHARTTEVLVNGTGTTVLTATDSRVGILQPQPNEALDVGGSIRSTAARVAGDVTVAGSVVAGEVDALGMAPVGTVVMWSGVVPPRGWSLCDGRVANGRQTPDLRGRFLMAPGHGQGLTPRMPGAIGGAEAHGLTTAEMPRHAHAWNAAPVTSGPGGNHTHPYISGYKAPAALATRWGQNRAPWEIDWLPQSNVTSSDGGHGHRVDAPAFQTASSGEGRPHNTMPPFHVLAFIMRVQ